MQHGHLDVLDGLLNELQKRQHLSVDFHEQPFLPRRPE
jgi:hypothetical protein